MLFLRFKKQAIKPKNHIKSWSTLANIDQSWPPAKNPRPNYTLQGLNYRPEQRTLIGQVFKFLAVHVLGDPPQNRFVPPLTIRFLVQENERVKNLRVRKWGLISRTIYEVAFFRQERTLFKHIRAERPRLV